MGKKKPDIDEASQRASWRLHRLTRSPPPISTDEEDAPPLACTGPCGSESPSLRLSLGFGPRFRLVAGHKGLTIEHITIILARLRIPRLSLGRLPGVRIHTLRVMALEEAPTP